MATRPRPLLLGDVFPDFACLTTHGNFSFHEFLQGDPECPWTLFFGHPNDFTPVCTTELGRAAQLSEEFRKRGVKMIGLSCNSVDSHLAWIEDIKCAADVPSLPFPIIADVRREIVISLGMLDPAELGQDGKPLPARYLCVIGPDMKLKLSILYPATTGRNFSEILRVIDSLQLTAAHGVATPADWEPPGRVVVDPSVSTEDAEEAFRGLDMKSLPSGKLYFRTVDMPRSKL